MWALYGAESQPESYLLHVDLDGSDARVEPHQSSHQVSYTVGREVKRRRPANPPTRPTLIHLGPIPSVVTVPAFRDVSATFPQQHHQNRPGLLAAVMLVSLTVGKVDAGVAVLLTEDKRLVCSCILQIPRRAPSLLRRRNCQDPCL